MTKNQATHLSSETVRGWGHSMATGWNEGVKEEFTAQLAVIKPKKQKPEWMRLN
jgi:hypothetical protein